MASAGGVHPGAPRLQLLLVEREDGDAVRLGPMLPQGRGSRFDVYPVPDVETALRFLQQERFDALLLDLDAGEERGIDALLRARIATTSLPVVVASADDDETLALRALRLGAQDYIIKREASPHVVTRTLLHAVERHQLIRQLTETRQREHFLASHDALTELPNRFYLEEFLTRSIEIARRRNDSVGVIFIDLDGFKAVNDSLGHSSGDELLRQAAARLLACVRRSDVVSRLGGDELVVALPDAEGVEGALRCARLVSQRLSDPFQIGARECWVSASIGVSLFPHDAADADALVRCADLAMYEAKRRGPNQIRLHHEGADTSLTDRFQLVNGLREAIAREELVLHYQAQIDLASGRAVSAEALPRWRHHSEGWVSPRVFIPIAEQGGIVGPIGDWVLQTACRDALGWGEELRVSVNVSRVQLSDSDFSNRVARILHQTGLPPRRLELEIVESSAASAEERCLANLSRLRDQGVRLALDDFGTGASSLSLLRTLPLDSIKLDESLVHESPGDARNELIIGSLVGMARGLGLELVAEGVESLSQLRLLQRQGCQRVQGYLLAKPTPAQDFAALLREAPWKEELARLA